jgi:hypothetical protein
MEPGSCTLRPTRWLTIIDHAQNEVTPYGELRARQWAIPVDESAHILPHRTVAEYIRDWVDERFELPIPPRALLQSVKSLKSHVQHAFTDPSILAGFVVQQLRRVSRPKPLRQ